MAHYRSVAELRQALSSDDADRRADAYGAVYGVDDDIEPRDVLGENPPKDILVEAGVVESEEEGWSRRETLEDIVDRLDELIEAVEGGGS